MEQELTFEVAGSSGVVYVIAARRTDEALTLTCTCDGAKNGAACRHRMALLAGDAAAVVSGNASEVAAISSWLPGTPLGQAIAGLAAAEAASETAKRAVTKAKKALGRVMVGDAGAA